MTDTHRRIESLRQSLYTIARVANDTTAFDADSLQALDRRLLAAKLRSLYHATVDAFEALGEEVPIRER